MSRTIASPDYCSYVVENVYIWFDNTEYDRAVMKHLFLSSIILLLAFLSCTEQDPDAIDTAQIEGRWQVESIRYEGTSSDGLAVSAEPEHCDIFWTGDIIEFKNGSVYMGEKGSSFYSSFRGYPGSINYSIVDHQLFIPEQVFPDYEEDAGGGWTFTFTTTVGEWSFPYTLSDDTWIIRHEHRTWFDIEYKYLTCDFVFVLKRVG